MTALVVYESMFGNTREVAEAIRRGLEEGGIAARLIEVGDAPTKIEEDIDLLVIGGPTHAFGMSRPSTRSDAARRSDGPLVSTGLGLREWLELVEHVHPPHFATFDTKVRRPLLPGSAARGAAKRLRHQHWIEVLSPATFYVGDMTGPLVDGELVRAEQWGASVAAAMTQRLVP